MGGDPHEQLDLRGQRVLVTGGHGFLGKHVCAALSAAGAVPLAVGRAHADLADVSAVHRMFERLDDPPLVIHAAAVGGGIGWMKAHPATALAGNLLANTNVLEVARVRGVRRLLGVSSACAYAKLASQPMVETEVYEGEPEPTNGPYGHSKRILMRHGAALFEEFGFDACFAIPTNMFGPGESFDPVRSHVVGALVRRFAEAQAAKVPVVTCWGTGKATRDLLFAPDAGRFLVKLLATGGGAEPINMGSGVERTIAEIATTVAAAAGYQGELRWDHDKPDGMPRKVLDLQRMHGRLGLVAQTPFAQGVRETVECFRSLS